MTTMILCRACAKRTHVSLLARSFPSEAKVFSSATRPLYRTSRDVQEATRELRQGADIDRVNGLATSRGTLQGANPPSLQLQRAVKQELKYLNDDPYLVANQVLATLSKGEFEKALLLTRKASVKGGFTVSWNHLIEYLMREQRLHSAIKLYNEMKKRGELPNAQTYTIIFDGCARSQHPRLAVSEAVRIYHSMMRSQRLQPNTRHLNAVLKVCSRARDIDSLFGVMQTAAKDGNRSPDHWTYSTILGALRVDTPEWRTATEESRGLSDAEREAALKLSIEESIAKAKAVWDEVVTKWRQGKIMIDEDLVCAMGRLLLRGDAKANDEVPSLIEQTMAIPRPDGQSDQPNQFELTFDTQGQGQNKESHEAGKTASKAPKGISRGSSLAYAKPGNNSLSLVLESLGATRKTSIAIWYWQLFVEEHGVQPDSENWFRFLRTLRIGRGSTKASEYLDKMPPAFIRPATLRVVMQTCIRDNLNEHAFENAKRALAVMRRALKTPDGETMRLFLQAAMANHHRFRAMDGESDGKAGTEALGRQIVAAMDALWDPMCQATSHFKFCKLSKLDHGPPEGQAALDHAEQSELVAVARRMVAACSKVLETSMVTDPETLERVRTRSSVMNRYVVGFFERRPALESKLPRRFPPSRAEKGKGGRGRGRGTRGSRDDYHYEQGSRYGFSNE